MAGKNRANTLSAILSNMQDLEGAYNDALSAEGSALKENAAYLDSIQGRIDLFTNEVQNFWMNTIESDMVKGVVNLGTSLVDLVDKIGLIPTALAGVLIYFTAFKKNNPVAIFKDLSASMHNYGFALKQIEAMKTVTGAVGNMSIDEYKAGPMNAYAAAVQNLTEKQQAAALASVGLTKAQIQETMAKNGVDAANIKQAMSEANVVTAKTATTSATVAEAFALKAEQTAKLSAAASNWLLENSNKQLTLSLVQEAVQHGVITPAIGAEIIAKYGLATANNAASVSFKGLTASIKAMMASNPVGWIMLAITAVIGLVTAVNQAKEEISQAANEVITKYEAMQSTIQSNKKTISEISEDYEKLSHGVDETGKNISLTSDEYERYNNICNQIADMFPTLISGYTAEGIAILSCKGNVEKLTQAYKDNAKAAYESVIAGQGTVWKDFENNFETGKVSERDAAELLAKYIDGTYDEDVDGALNAGGATEALLAEIGLKPKWSWANLGNEDFVDFLNRSIEENLTEIQALINDKTRSYNAQAEPILSVLNSYLRVDEEGYGQLSEEYQKVISNIVNSFDTDYLRNFESITDVEAHIDSLIEKMKDPAVSEFVSNLSKVQTEFADGHISYGEYKKQLDDNLQQLKEHVSESEFSEIKIGIGIDEEYINPLINHTKKILSTDIKDVDNMIDSLSLTDLEIAGNLSVPEGSIQSWDELKQKIADAKNAAEENVISVKTYSSLIEEIENYNDLFDQTSEIVADNTKVTEEYKDSLIELGISEEDLNECFDDNNKLVVKDAKALNNLVKAAKKNTAQNIRLAKSQARLEYYELYKEMKALTNGTEVTDKATLSYINSLYEQMNVLQRTIAKYSLLEAELLGAANAYSELADAQAADEAMDYGSKAEELVNVLAEAFNTAQLGTESARVAIEGLIPDDVIDKSKTLDEQMQQVYDYFTKGPVSQLFTIEFDDEGAIQSVEMTKENIQKFTESLIGTDEDSVFHGTWDEFTINPAIKNLEDFANAIGATKEVAFAYLTEMEKYDIGNVLGGGDSLLDQLMGDNLDYQLQKAIETAAEVEKKLAEGTLKANSQEYQDAQKNLEAREEQAIEDVTAWSRQQQALEKQKDLLKEYQKEYEKAVKNQDTSKIEEFEGKIKDTSKEIDVLIGDLRELDEPTEFVLEVAMSEAKENIAEFKEDIDELAKSGDEKAIKINSFIEKIDTTGLDDLESLGFVKGPDGVWRGTANIEGWSELDPASKQKVLEYINMIEGEHQIDVLMGEGTVSVEEQLNTIAKILEDIAKILDPTYTLSVDTTDAEQKAITFKSIWDGIKSKAVTLTKNVVETVTSFFTRTPKEGDGADNVNGTANAGGSWGAPKTETSLVGELGPEILVRGNRWTTVGDNGAEFTQVKKGDIIFNHRQTEELLKNGHVTSRGKAYAGGTAYAKPSFKLLQSGIDTWDNAYQTVYNDYSNATIVEDGGKVDTSGDNYDLKDDYGDGDDDAEDIFEETFDWIEVRLEEINEELNLKSAQLENAIGSDAQNAILDEMIDINEELRDNLLAGADKYYAHAETLLAKVPAEYRAAAQDGSIAIQDFIDAAGSDINEEALNAIQEYREWVQNGADATQQAEEVLTEIQSLAKQAFDNIANDFENKLSIHDSKISQLEANNDLLETDKGWASESVYEAIKLENEAKKALLQAERDALQQELSTGKIKEGTDAWYEAVNAIAEVDAEIINLNTEIENLQDSINELNWEQFEFLITQFQVVADEAENLLDILATKDAVDELGNWTDEGVASLGLLAQQMEVAEKQASKYEAAIEYLNEHWEELGYTQQEYVERLDELKSGQYDAITSYHDAKDAIVELNEARVDAIKDGIEKEIEAYEKLIDAKKEELDAEKDLYDFQKGVAEQQKDIADIERKLAALSNDNSASARAQRAKLEAELYEAKASLEETYYDRSINDQQDALDKELESFQETKEAEIEGWEKYLENVEHVVADSLAMVQENTKVVYAMLAALGQQYGLDITTALTAPWLAGETAIQDYGTKLNVSLTTLAAMFGLTVDEFAAKLGLTTEMLVSNLDITVAQMAENLGLTNDQLAARLGLTVANLNGMMDFTIQELAAKMGITLPALAERLGTTTAGLAGNLDMTMAQFAGSMGLTVEDLAGKFGLTAQGLADKLGMTYQELTNPFGLSMSATVDALKALETEYSNILASIEGESKIAVDEVNKAMQKYQEQNTNQQTQKPQEPVQQPKPEQITVGSRINAGSARIYATSQGTGGGKQYFASDPIYTVLKEVGDYVLVRHHKLSSGYTGWFKKSDIKAYAKGSKGVDSDQWAILDELGEELQLVPNGQGRLAYIKKGTGIVPADMTTNLMAWGELDPQDMLDRNRPAIGAPHIVNNEINITMEIGEVVHIDRVDHDTLPDLTKAVRKEMDSYMLKVNNAIKSKVR